MDLANVVSFKAAAAHDEVSRLRQALPAPVWRSYSVMTPCHPAMLPSEPFCVVSVAAILSAQIQQMIRLLALTIPAPGHSRSAAAPPPALFPAPFRFPSRPALEL